MTDGLTELPVDATRLFATSILEGGGALSKLSLTFAQQPLRWYTMLPPHSRVLDFFSGGHYEGQWQKYSGGIAQSVANDDARIVQLISEYLSNRTDAFGLLENSIARPNDPFVLSLESIIRLCETSVLHWLPPHSTIFSTQQALQEAKRTPNVVGVLGKDYFVVETMAHSRQLELDTVKRAVARTTALIISAYDGESYVLGVHE